MQRNLAGRDAENEVRSHLDEIVRLGAQKMLTAALDEEVREFLERHQDILDPEGRRQVVGNGGNATFFL